MSSEATNFFVRQDAARRGTRKMVFLFGLGVFSTIALIELVITLAMGRFDPSIFLMVLIFVGGGILIAYLFKVYELSHGGKTVALALGGRPVSADPRDPDERKLRNVIEEMAIASGVPVPEIYILDQELSINAFAAGYSPADAVIGVTRGAIKNLNREELQGVVAHEFSHILNGDMKLNIRLISLIFGLLFLTVIGRILLYTRPSSSRNDKNSAAALLLLGLLLILLGWISVLFGKMIQAAISRQREHLADASAVQFTRNPLGLAAALKKIGALAQHSYIASPKADEAAHLFFASGLSGFWSNLFATHPPLVKRIQLLDPTFDGDFTKPIPSSSVSAQPKKVNASQKTSRSQGENILSLSLLAGGQGTTDTAHQLLETLPSSVRELCTDPLGAMSLIYSTLLEKDSQPLQYQLNRITRTYGESMARTCTQSAAKLSNLSRSQKLALVSLCTPTLRGMAPAQFEAFNQVLRDLVLANNQVDLFEFCVLKNIEHNLKNYFTPHNKRLGKASVNDLESEIHVVLSLLARSETTETKEVEKAFLAGYKELGLQGTPAPILHHTECTFEALESALDEIAEQASPDTLKRLLTACHTIVATTNLQITEDEANLLKAISLALLS